MQLSDGFNSIGSEYSDLSMSATSREYSDKVPEEAKHAADGLSGQNDLRWAVIIALLENGKLRFSGLEETLNVHSQSLSDALRPLQSAGIITKIIEENEDGRLGGYYQVTEFGEDILSGFYEATRSKYEGPDSHGDFTSVQNYQGASIERPLVEKVTEAKHVETTAMGRVSKPDVRYRVS